MNSLLSGLGNSQGNSGCGCATKKPCCNNNDGGFCGGGNSIIWIIILLCLCGGFGQGQNTGTVCGCEKKHCKELCRCGSSNTGGCGFGGLGGFGGGCGGGSGIWIIIILLLCFCGGNGKQGKGCTNNFINLDNCEEDC